MHRISLTLVMVLCESFWDVASGESHETERAKEKNGMLADMPRPVSE